jgi:hypothetical protein
VLLTAASLGLAIVMVAGCGGSSGSTPSSSPSAPATAVSPTADPQAAAKATVLAVYRKMWDTSIQAYQAGSSKGTHLEDYTTDKALSGVYASIVYYRDGGTTVRGKPVLSPEVTAVSLDTQPRTASITDCLDTTHYVEVSRKTGKPVATADKVRRHVATATARITSGTWKIVTFSIDRERTC